MPPRALRRAALACTAFCLLVSSARASASRSWVEIVRDDDTGMELVLHAPEPARDGARLGLPGFAACGEPGLPRFYEQAVLVGVPGPDGARLEIVALDEERIPGVEPEHVPWPPRRSPEGAAPQAEPAAPHAAWSGRYPERAVTLGRSARLRGRDVVTLRFAPLQYTAEGGAILARRVRMRLSFADRPRPRHERQEDEILHANLLNAATAARWGLVHEVQARRPAPVQAQVPGTTERLRIRIARTGVYELPYDRLRSANVPVDALDPTTFQIFFDRWRPIPLFADSTPASWEAGYALQEAAIWVPGEENHVFELGEKVVFYALGASEYVDRTGETADSLLHAHHPYDDSRYAWLVWDQQAGRRMPEAVSPPVVGEPADLVRRTWQRVHFEEDRQFDKVDDLWYWEEASRLPTNRPAAVSFALDLGGETQPAGAVRIGIGSSFSQSRHVLEVRLNNRNLGSIVWDQPSSLPRPAYFTFNDVLLASNSLRLTHDPSLSRATSTFLLKLDAVWERPLARPATGSEEGRLRWSRRPAGADEAYELAGFGATAPVVLDVSDPLLPVRLTGPTRVGSGSSTLWRLRYGRGSGNLTHFIAVTTPALVAISDIVLRPASPLRLRETAPDMLVVAHASLLPEAERFAAHRRAHFPDPLTGRQPDVQVVDVADIYDNFSGGSMDPLAIRNYAKFLYLLRAPDEAETRLRYLMLFGEATHDPRQQLPGSTTTLVPTVQPWYADASTLREYAVDDWLAEMETPVNYWVVFPLPDLAVGRITPRSLSEAQRIIDKIIAYDTSTDYGAWRTRVLLSADDECSPRGGCEERYHIVNTEQLVPLTPLEWDISKTYLTEYDKVLGQKPTGRAHFIQEWSAGCTLVNYQGHGAPRQLADEVLLLGADVPSLANGRRLPVFMAFSCTVSEFDSPELQCMSEDMVASAHGGAVATMGATTPTFGTENAIYSQEIWQGFFAPPRPPAPPGVAGATSKVPLGLVHQLAKNGAPVQDGRNNECYVLLGDPSMVLLAPEAVVRFTAGADTLEAGRSARVVGQVEEPQQAGQAADFDGVADVEVFGTADDSGYISPDDPLFRIRYDLVGPPIYRGSVEVRAGRFEFEFVVPLGARLGSKARLSAYAYDTSRAQDAKGATNNVRVVSAAEPDSSTGSPRISLRFPNNVTRVRPGTPLLAEIRDENGINIQGTTLPSSILLDFDGANQPLNVTGQFRYAQGSDSVGTLSVPLPEDLAPGQHTASLIASDNLQNRSTASIGFEVIAATSEQLVNVVAFPNPFKDRTFFFFELTDPADVLVRVYTTSGREVWRDSRFVSEPQQVSIRWDGVDLSRDELANGTYIYRVEAHPRRPDTEEAAGRKGPVLKHTGTVVIMRE